MTVSVERQGEGKIRVTITHGVMTVTSDEDWDDLRSVWNHLGRLIDQMDGDKSAS